MGTQGHLRHARQMSGPRVSTHAAKLTSSEAPWGPQGVDQNGAGTGNGRKSFGKRDMGGQIKEGTEACLRSLGVTRRLWAQELIVNC